MGFGDTNAPKVVRRTKATTGGLLRCRLGGRLPIVVSLFLLRDNGTDYGS